MFTASIISKEIINGSISLTVEFTDGNTLCSQVFTSDNPTSEWLQFLIDDKIAKLTAVNDFVTQLDNGDIQSTTFTINQSAVAKY